MYTGASVLPSGTVLMLPNADVHRRPSGRPVQRLFGVMVRGTDSHRLDHLTQAPLSIQRGIRLCRAERQLPTRAFVSPTLRHVCPLGTAVVSCTA